MTVRPSSMPALAQCGQFEPGGSDFADLGTDRHAALQAHYAGDNSLLDLLDEDSQAGIRWAADYIRVHAAASDYPMEWERKRSFTAPNFTDITGTPDLVCGNDVFDFKWRYRDYTAQMACYALMMIAELAAQPVRVHLLFGEPRRAEVLKFDTQSAEAVIAPILDRLDANPEPTPCDYCGWCTKRLMCPAMTRPAQTVALGYSDLAEVANWHPSEMEKPEHLALALHVWRKVLKKWGESVEFHAMEAMTKRGLQLPGCKLAPSKGKQFVADCAAAYAASGLPAEKFLKACTPRLNTSKKYPDRVGLDVIFKEHFSEASTAAAKRTVLKKLGALIQRGQDGLKIVLTGGDSADAESED